jgi:hypothetical protein
MQVRASAIKLSMFADLGWLLRVVWPYALVLGLGLGVGLSWDWLSEQYMLHSHCYQSDPWIGGPYVAGHALTGFAYLAIPAQIVLAHRRHPDQIPMWAALGSAGFVAACGVGHLLEALTHVWWAGYRLIAWWGLLVTAPLSVGTALLAHRVRVSTGEALDEAAEASELRELVHAVRALRTRGEALTDEAVEAIHDLRELTAFRRLVDEMGLYLVVTDGEYIVDANPPLIHLLEEDPRTLAVERYLEIFTEQVAPTLESYNAATEGSQTRHELAIGPRDGRHRTRVVWYSASDPGSGRTYGIGYRLDDLA